MWPLLTHGTFPEENSNDCPFWITMRKGKGGTKGPMHKQHIFGARGLNVISLGTLGSTPGSEPRQACSLYMWPSCQVWQVFLRLKCVTTGRNWGFTPAAFLTECAGTMRSLQIPPPYLTSSHPGSPNPARGGHKQRGGVCKWLFSTHTEKQLPIGQRTSWQKPRWAFCSNMCALSKVNHRALTLQGQQVKVGPPRPSYSQLGALTWLQHGTRSLIWNHDLGLQRTERLIFKRFVVG